MTTHPDGVPDTARAEKPPDDVVAGIRMRQEKASLNERKRFHHWLTVRIQISLSTDLGMLSFLRWSTALGIHLIGYCSSYTAGSEALCHQGIPPRGSKDAGSHLCPQTNSA